jgi:deazaflavin-dependent oxidoreductase (nitroreductase family)
MRDDARQALAIGPSTPIAERTVDITTTGRRSGEPRRIETVFYRHGEDIYLSGIPAPKPRAWLLNLQADPHFTFHLKHRVVADLPAVGSVVSDVSERERILASFVEQFNARRDPAGPFPVGVVSEWVDGSPLVRVTFPDPS